jgi:HlyD family secretion protein
MFKNIYLLYKYIIKNFKSKIIKFQILIILNSILQVLSIISFGPLILKLTKNENFKKYQDFYFQNFSDESFLILIIFFVIITFIISNIFNIIVAKSTLVLGQSIGLKLVSDLFLHIVHKDYSYFLKTNSSEIISKITLESGRVINNIIVPMILIISKLFMSLFIFAGLAIVNIKISLFVLFFFIISYLLLFSIQKKKIKKNSQAFSKSVKTRQKIIAETFNNIRETILFDSKKFFLDLFNRSNTEITASLANIQFLSVMPRYIIEIFGFLLIMITISFFALTNTLSSFLPIIAIYLVAGYKLLPALQNIASSYASIKGSYSSLEVVMPDLKEIDEMATDSKIYSKYKKIDFDSLSFEKINFSYSHKKVIFNDANFKISKNKIVGLIGKTGIGKSTFIDIFCGLIRCENGRIVLNNENIEYRKYKDIKNLISIVTQKINLLDDTIKNNIFFGRREIGNLDNELEYLKKTCLLDYVDNNNSKWDMVIGENGSRLSGGQIQRLAIARALYGRPQILILDEATAGLDSNSEQEIIKNLINFKPKMTILIISHNRQILNVCDNIYEIKNQKFEKIK